MRATPDDMDSAGRLLHDFNTEFEDITPGPEKLAERLRELLAEGDTEVFLAGDGPDGVAVLRFRRSLWTPGLEAYLAELYVAPAHRGNGFGRALMEEVLAAARQRGSDYIELGTGANDTAARALYESLGFTNSDDGPGAPVNYLYELEL